MVRPEAASFLMLAGVFVLLRSALGQGRRLVVALPVLTAGWINVHSLAFLAPLTVAWHALISLWRTGAVSGSDDPAQQVRWMFASAAASFFVTSVIGSWSSLSEYLRERFRHD